MTNLEVTVHVSCYVCYLDDASFKRHEDDMLLQESVHWHHGATNGAHTKPSGAIMSMFMMNDVAVICPGS
eukprot:scaffold205222_cov26-Prasinocladus_malaysianus.AAC.2